MVSKFHFLLKPRLVEELADLRSGKGNVQEEMYKMNLDYLVMPKARKLFKTKRAGQKDTGTYLKRLPLAKYVQFK